MIRPPLRGSLASFLLVAFPLIVSLCGCAWHGVLKQDTAIGWGGRAIAVASDPGNEQFVMAASPTGGVFQSALGGSAWSHVDSMPEFGCFDLRFSPDNPNIVIATAIEDTKAVNGGGIWISTDHGNSWTHPPSSIRKDANGIAVPQSAFGISFEPGTRKIFVGTDQGLAVSEDLGSTWSIINSSSNSSPSAVYAVLALSNGRVLTYGESGLWMSADGATKWHQDSGTTAFGGFAIAHALAVSPISNNDVFLTDSFTTLLHSSDGGETFVTAGTSPSANRWNSPANLADSRSCIGH